MVDCKSKKIGPVKYEAVGLNLTDDNYKELEFGQCYYYFALY